MFPNGLASGGHAVLIRSIAALAFVVGIGLGGCVGLDKPKEVAACAARNNCTDNWTAATGGASGAVSVSGGSAGAVMSSTGGSAGTTTTSLPGTGGQGPSLGGAAADARAAGGAVASGGAGRDAAADRPLGPGGAVGSGGIGPGTGGLIDAPIATGGTLGTGGKVGSGGEPGTGGSIATGGAMAADARSDVPSDASPLLTGLVAYYTFESASGTDLPDVSGKGNTGKLSIGTLPDGGAPTGTGYDFVTGKIGKALALHKAGVGYVKVPTAVFANATDITIAVWANVTTSQNWQRLLDVGINAKLAQNTQTGTKYLNIVPKNEGSNMLFSLTTNGYGSEQTLTAPNLAVGVWTHVVLVLAANAGGKLYVNGAQAGANASLSLRAADLGAIDYAFIAKSQFTADPAFDGSVDEFRVYNRALSEVEVQALYAFTGP